MLQRSSFSCSFLNDSGGHKKYERHLEKDWVEGLNDIKRGKKEREVRKRRQEGGRMSKTR